MKLVMCDDEFLIYLGHNYFKDVDLFDLESLEVYMNELFTKLKKIYNLKLNGYYIIDIYLDDNYGAIIKVKNENLEYYDYFKDQIDTQISIHSDSFFLYKINDLFEVKKILNNNYDIYRYNNELYIKLNEKINENKFVNLLEYCTEICYDIENIVKKNNLLYCNK